MSYEEWIEKVRKLIIDYDGGYFTAKELVQKIILLIAEIDSSVDISEEINSVVKRFS